MAKDQMAEVVTAMTYASEEYDTPPQRVHGKLTIHHVSALGYDQYLVDGTPVDPDTVDHGALKTEERAATENYDPDQQRDARGRWSREGGDELPVGDYGKYPGRSVIRWMGSQGYNFKQVRTLLDDRGIDATDAAIRSELSKTKAGKGGKLADLSQYEQDMIHEHVRQQGSTVKTGKAALKTSGGNDALKTSGGNHAKVQKSGTELIDERDAAEKLVQDRHEFRKQMIDSSGSTADFVRDKMRLLAGDAGHVNVHGMSHSEHMQQMTIDGMLFKWPHPGSEDQAARSIANVLSSVHKLPEKLWRSTDEVVFTDQRNRNDPFWAQEYNDPSFKSVATGGDGRVCVYNGAALSSDTMSHEAGHNFAKRLWFSTDPPPNSDFGKTQEMEVDKKGKLRVKNAVSRYGRNSRAEDFAESCSMWSSTIGKGTLKSQHPDRYKALSDLLGES